MHTPSPLRKSALPAPSATPASTGRRLQYQPATPSRQDPVQYGVGNQPGAMAGFSSTLGGNGMPPPTSKVQPSANNNTTAASTMTVTAAGAGGARRSPGQAAVARGGGGVTTTGGATETAEPLVDKPKPKRKDKPPRVPPPQTIQDTGSRKTYTRGPSLGEGGFASCYELTDEEGNRFAAKVIQKIELASHKTKHKLFAEIKIHQSINHPNVVQYYHCFEDDDFVYLLLELCESKTLMELLKRRKVVTEPEARFYMKEIISATVHLHDQKIIHRDLKLGNIFLSHDMHVKLGDFGLAALILNEGDRKKTICGTPNYIAPEILFDTSGHSFEVDIWSLGCIMYTLLIGKPPFQTNDVRTIYKNIRDLNYTFPSDIPISKEAKDLIAKLLTPKPDQRPTASNILQDEFFTSGYCPRSLPRSTLHSKPKFDQELLALQRQKQKAQIEEERHRLQVQQQQQLQGMQDVNPGARLSIPTPAVYRQQQLEQHQQKQQKMNIPVAKTTSSARAMPAQAGAQFGFGEEVRMEMVKGGQIVTEEVRTVNIPRSRTSTFADQPTASHMQQQQYPASHRQSVHYSQQDNHAESTTGLHRQPSQSSLSRFTSHTHSLSHHQQQQQRVSSKPLPRDAVWQIRQGQYSLNSISTANPTSTPSASLTNAHGSLASVSTATRSQLPFSQHSSTLATAQRPNGSVQLAAGSTMLQSRLPMAKSRFGQGGPSPQSSPRFGSPPTMGSVTMSGSTVAGGMSSSTPGLEYQQDVPNSPRANNHLRGMSSDLAMSKTSNAAIAMGSGGSRMATMSYARSPMQSHFNRPTASSDAQRTPTFGGGRTLPSNVRSLKTYREQQPVDESLDLDMEVDRSLEVLDDDDDDERMAQLYRQQRNAEGQDDLRRVHDPQQRGFQLQQRTSSGSTLIQTVTGVERPASAMKRTYRSERFEADDFVSSGGRHGSMPQSSSQGRPLSQSGLSSDSKIEYPSKELEDIHMNDNQDVEMGPPQTTKQQSRQQPSQTASTATTGFLQGHGRHASQHVSSSQLSPFSQHSRHFSQQASQQLSQKSMPSQHQQGGTLSQFSREPGQFSQPFATQQFSSQPMTRSRSEHDEWRHPSSPVQVGGGNAVAGQLAGLERARTLSQYSRGGGGGYEIGPLDTPPPLVQSSQQSLSQSISNVAAFMPPERMQRREQMYNDSNSSDMMERDLDNGVEDNTDGLDATAPAGPTGAPSRLPAMDSAPPTPTHHGAVRTAGDQRGRRRSSHHHELHRPRPDIVQGSRQQLQQQRQLQQQLQVEQQMREQEQKLAQQEQQLRQLQEEGMQHPQPRRLHPATAATTTTREMQYRRHSADILVPVKREEDDDLVRRLDLEVPVKFEDDNDVMPVKQEDDTLNNPSDRPLQETHMSGHSGEQDHVEVPSTSGGATSLSLSITADKAMGPLESVHKYLGLMLREYKLGRFPSAWSTYSARPVPTELMVLPSPIPTCYVARWCDYSQSYGTGFGTVNGVTGVLFNDGCVGLLAPNDVNVEYIIHPNSPEAKRSRRSRSHRSRHSRESGAESGSASDNPSTRLTESTSSLEGGGDGKHRGRSTHRSVSRGGGAERERRTRDTTSGSKSRDPAISSATLLHKKKPSLTLKKEGNSPSSSSISFSSPTTPLATPTTAVSTTGGDPTGIATAGGEGSARPSTEWDDAVRAPWMAGSGNTASNATALETLNLLAKASGGNDGGGALQQDPNLSVSTNLRKRQYHGAEDDAYEERLKGRRSVIGRRTGNTDTETDGESDQEARTKEQMQRPVQQSTPLLAPLTTMSGPSASGQRTPITSAAASTGNPTGGALSREHHQVSSHRLQDNDTGANDHLDAAADDDDDSEESWDEEDAHTALRSVERHCYTQTRCPSRFLPRIRMLPQFRDYMLKQKLDVPLTLYKDQNLVADMPFLSGFYQIQQNLLVLRLSDGTVQVNFEDHEKLVFSDHGRTLIYIQSSKKIYAMSLKNALLGIAFKRQSSSSRSADGKKAMGGLAAGLPGNNANSRGGNNITLAGLDPPSPSPSAAAGAATPSPQPQSGQQQQQQQQQQQEQSSPVPPVTDTYKGVVLYGWEHKELINKLKLAYKALQQLARIRKLKRKQKAATGQQVFEEFIITKKKEESGN